MQKVIYFFIVIFLTNCINKDSLKPILPSHLLHSNSSKVWVLNQHILNKNEVSPSLRENKKALILFDNLEFIEQELIHLGSNIGRTGQYSLALTENSDTIFNLFYSDSKSFIKYKVKYISVKELTLLKSESDSSEVLFYHTLSKRH